MRLLLALCLAWASTAAQADIISARYTDPTDRYTHGILGDAIEWGGLEMTTAQGKTLKLTLPTTHVFEDTSPRIIDIDQDGDGEVMVVETDMAQGARLAIYDQNGLVAATPYIGRTNRWLAPIGAADLDGEGAIEVAYIDRPHLAKTLRVWRYADDQLIHVADLPGLTNHRIGDADIPGGLRDCGQGVEMITADASWTHIMASTFTNGKISTKIILPHTGRASFTNALNCL